MKRGKREATKEMPKYPGIPTAVDGSTAIVEMETAASEAAGAYPITPSTQMGEGWAAAVAAGKTNVHGRKLIFFEPEGEHAAAAVTAGMSMVGLRATNFSSGQGIAYMHESLYPAVGKRLTYILNVACRAMTKHSLNVHAGHDDYHAVDDTGFFQLFAKDPQEAADLNLISHRIAELSLNPGICAQDGFLTSHVIQSTRLPERALVKEFLGDPADIIDSPTPAQRMVFGERRRRIPEMFDLDYPAMLGVVQNQDSYLQGVAAQRPFYFDHLTDIVDRAMAEYEALTGRHYARAIGYRLDDAEFVIVGQGSVVPNAEVVCDYLRDERKIKVGVLNITMFRPFPEDLVTRMLRGKQGVTVLERVDQPLAADAPMLREIRAVMMKALENSLSTNGKAYPSVGACAPSEMPVFYSGCFGLGSRDLQPNQLVAAVENMMDGGRKRKQFYLGIEFVRQGTELPKLRIWQEQLLDSYPDIAGLALPAGKAVNLLPPDSTSIRIHSVGGWGAITMGKNLAMTASELLGLNIQANPKYGSEKKGQPTTFYATLAQEPLRLNCELHNVNAVLSPDPNVFRHSDPLAGLTDNGIFVIQNDVEQEDFWNGLSGRVQQSIESRQIKVFVLDAFTIAADEASDAALRYRMQGAAFMGAFFKISPLIEREGLDEAALFSGIRTQLSKKFGHLGERIVEDNVRVIRRGYDEVRALDYADFTAEGDEPSSPPIMPAILDGSDVQDGIGDPGRFWEQVCHLYRTGTDGIADPFAAISAIPAATSTIRDMTDVRFEVPKFIPANCTGCSQCWTQCPDTAIPGVVNTVEEVIATAINTISNGVSFDRVRQIIPHLGRESRRIMKGVPFTTFADVLSTAYKTVVDKLKLNPERRTALDSDFAAVFSAISDFPLAKTAPFFDVPESKEKGTGGLLSITVNPETCKGCNICVDVCPDDALITVKQDEEVVERLRHNWKVWEHLPDTDDRYIKVASIEEGIGVLPSLLLKKQNYRSMLGGDGACMGCGEKTVIHLVLSAVNALMLPRVKNYLARLDELIDALDAKARQLLASDADLETVGQISSNGDIDIPLTETKHRSVERITDIIRDLKDLHWRYAEGPSGKGRATCGIANATGCSSVWGSTYPYNPYPVPWVNHLFQDAPSIAIGIFEGHMRKMADGFVAVRRAELELSGEYDPETHDPFLGRFDWRQFTDEEFSMCPPIFAVGGDGAMLDIGFQNLSRLLASGKPIRVIVLDTQVYSNTGGQACTSGFLGQVSDMAAYGTDQHGKEETRKELALIAMAHGNVFVVQSSQAAASHLIEGVLKGLQVRSPAVFALHCPCPPEHGLADDAATRASRLALESRAFPLLTYDPSAGPAIADQLCLDGNPMMDDRWPSYEMTYVDENGEDQKMTLPITIADWAATETRFQKHFSKIKDPTEVDNLVPFHNYMDLPAAERDESTPFIYVLQEDRTLKQLSVAEEIVRLAEDRLHIWSQLRQMAGLEVAPVVRQEIQSELQGEFARREEEIRAEYESRLAELKTSYPRTIARRMAQGLMRAGNGKQTLADLLAKVQAMPGLEPIGPDLSTGGLPATATATTPSASAAPTPVEVAEPTSAIAQEDDEEEDDELVMGPYVDSILCTTCDECTRLNGKLFAYDDKKQAYIKDPNAGTFRQLVMAAEKCPVLIIHPGTPLNPNERDLDKWIKRAEPFN